MFNKWMLLALVALFPYTQHARGLTLCTASETLVTIHVPENSDETTVLAATSLSEKLGKIFEKPFPIEHGDGMVGIFLGTLEDYPEFHAALDPSKLGGKEAYSIKTLDGRVMLIGTSPLGVQNAVWEFLHLLGYRQYFPSEKWEIIPKLDSILIDFDITSYPDFATRRFFIYNNTWPELREEFKNWKTQNRLVSGYRLNSTHAYDYIVQRNREVFEANPDFLTHEIRDWDNKFNIANPELRQLVIEDSLRQLERYPNMHSLSMDPSDGGNWGGSSPLGSITDQVITLANEVAAALRKESPGIKVGVLAYSYHSPPPTIPVDKDVIISVTNGFIRGGYTTDQLIEEWGDRTTEALGIYEYFGIWPWDNDMPGKARATSPEILANKIMSYHDRDVRYFTAEMSHAFGPSGLGHYIAARSLWDVSESLRVSQITKEFLKNSFGSASQAMGRFYAIIDGEARPLLSEALIGDMYRALAEAYENADTEIIRNRIDDLTAYTRFVELYYQYLNVRGEDRQIAFDRLVDYSIQIRRLGTVHTWALLHDQPTRDRSIQFSRRDGIEDYSAPTREDYLSWVQYGSQTYETVPFTVRGFGGLLRPLSEMVRPPSVDDFRWSTLEFYPGGSQQNTIYTYQATPDEEIRLRVTGGKSFGDRGDIKIRVYPELEAHSQAVAEHSVPPDKQEHEISFRTGFEGLHRIVIEDGRDWTVISWPTHQHIAFSLSPTERPRIDNKDALYFFVPADVDFIGGYSSASTGDLRSPDGIVALRFDEVDQGYFHIPVEPQHRGQVWMVRNTRGAELFLHTVPPYASLSRRQLLIPEDANPR